MALGRVSDLRKSSCLLSKGCAAFRGRGHRRHERHAEARPTCHLCSFSDSLLGNLIVGYNESRVDQNCLPILEPCTDIRTGSHNVVVGPTRGNVR